MSPVAFLLGPTGSGKTELARIVAREHGAVVLTADARQVYRGLDVATAKEPLDGVAQIGLDLVDPAERMTAARWVAWARPTVDALVEQGTRVLVTAGTPLYAEALLRGFQFPDTDPAVRTALARRGTERRAVRRDEIELLGGTPPRDPPAWRAPVVGLDIDAAELKHRIEARVRGWFFGEDLFEEVRGFLAAGLPRDVEALTAIGYEEALAVIEGTMTREEGRAQALARTWAYVRRQRSYFRAKFPETRWATSAEEARELLEEAFTARTGSRPSTPASR